MPSKLEGIVQVCANCSARTADVQPATLGRRQFISAGLIAAAAAALAACSGAGTDSTTPTNVSLSVKISDYPALSAVGGVALVNASGSPIAIVRTGASAFVALSRICPHQGSTVNATSTGFLCPNHGARFDKTGVWTGGERTSSMHAYASSYDLATDTLTIG